MVETALSQPAIELRGQPPRFRTTFVTESSVEPFCDLRLDLPVAAQGGPPLIAQVTPAGPGPLRFLTFLLAEWTPPGTYRGEVRLGEEWRPVLVLVEPRPSLRLLPERHDLTAVPGTEVSVDVTVVNVGNTHFELAPSHAVALTDAAAVDRILARTAIAEIADGERRIDRLGDELAAVRGGAVVLRLRQGAGAIGPGEARPCQATLQVPDRLRPGRTYVGRLRLAETSLYLRITASNGTAAGEPDDDGGAWAEANASASPGSE